MTAQWNPGLDSDVWDEDRGIDPASKTALSLELEAGPQYVTLATRSCSHFPTNLCVVGISCILAVPRIS